MSRTKIIIASNSLCLCVSNANLYGATEPRGIARRLLIIREMHSA